MMNACLGGYVRVGAFKVELIPVLNPSPHHEDLREGVEEMSGRIHALAFFSMG